MMFTSLDTINLGLRYKNSGLHFPTLSASNNLDFLTYNSSLPLLAIVYHMNRLLHMLSLKNVVGSFEVVLTIQKYLLTVYLVDS